MHLTNLTRRAALAAPLVALGALVAAAPGLAEMRKTPEPGRTYRIGFAQIVDHPALNATRQGFLDALKAAGFIEGKNLVFEYQNAQGNVGTAHDIIQKFIADKVDLLAPCTTPVVLTALRLTKGSKIPVVFGCVTNPLQTHVLTNLDKPSGTNVTGFYTIPPVKRNFDVMLAIDPRIKTIGTIYNSGESNSEALNKLAKAEAEKRGLKWVTKTISGSAEILNAARSLVGNVDAIMTPQDNTVASAYAAIVKVSRENKLPWFSLDVLAVKSGAISAVAQHQYQNGVDWAKKVAIPVLLGKDPGTIVPVEAEVFEEQINLEAAKAVGLTVPEAVLKKATKVFK
jgi:putative ABC transport system substrate-binding protein